MQPHDRYNSLFQFFAEKHDLDWLLLKAQAKAESAFDPDALSDAGAAGLTQFMPKTWSWAVEMGWIPPASSRNNPERSIAAQAGYMAWLVKKFNGDRRYAIAAYNWGPGHVEKIHLGSFDNSALPKETRSYLARIRKDYEAWSGKPL